MKQLRAHMLQPHPRLGDITTNSEAILTALSDRALAGADLVVIPRGGLTGGPLANLADDRAFQLALRDTRAALISRLGEQGENGETTYVFAADASHLWVARAGQLTALAAITPGLWQLTCANRAIAFVHSSHIARVLGTLVDLQVDLVVVLAEDVFDLDLQRRIGAQLRALALLSNVPVAYANRGGSANGFVYAAASAIYDARGTAVAQTPAFRTDPLSFQLDEFGGVESNQQVEELTQLEAIYRALVLGLRSYVSACGATSVVLGLSGGIDSALVAAIAADALGGEHVIGVSMPSHYSSAHSRSDAAATAELLGLDYRTVAIAPMVDTFMTQLPVDGVAAENVQARIRGQILMAISNQEGPLVLATGNRTEVAVGYSTMYGDSVGGYAPIGDVPKTLVWELSRWRNQVGTTPAIPEGSITKPPSAELRPDQQDSDSLPPYDELDAIIEALIDRRENMQQIIARGFEPGTVARVVGLVERAEWKRHQFAHCTKISPVTFGVEYLMPSVHHFQPRSS